MVSRLPPALGFQPNSSSKSFPSPTQRSGKISRTLSHLPWLGRRRSPIPLAQGGGLRCGVPFLLIEDHTGLQDAGGGTFPLSECAIDTCKQASGSQDPRCVLDGLRQQSKEQRRESLPCRIVTGRAQAFGKITEPQESVCGGSSTHPGGLRLILVFSFLKPHLMEPRVGRPQNRATIHDRPQPHSGPLKSCSRIDLLMLIC